MLQSRHAYNQGRRCESARNRICGTNAPATLPQLECQLISNRQVLAERSVGREGGREEVNRADATRGRRNLVRRTIGHRLPSATVFFQLLVIGVYLLRLLIANTARRCITPPISLPPPLSPSTSNRSFESCSRTRTAVESISNRSNPRNSIVRKKGVER